MLVLSRKCDEEIIIGNEIAIDNNISIVVVQISGDKVRLGIKAPKHIPVHRREVFDAVLKKRLQEVSEENAIKTS